MALSDRFCPCLRHTAYLPFIGLAIILAALFTIVPNRNNPDGSCTGVVVKSYETEYEYDRKVREDTPKATLHHIPKYNHRGKCLDGSAPAFYFRPGSATSKYHIHFEGPSGFCFDYKTCAKRKENVLGSSTTYGQFAWIDDLYLSTNKEINSLSYDWNVIFVRYCDGMAYLADKRTISVYDHEQIYFEGFSVIKNLLHHLFIAENEFSLDQATDIIFSGSAVGGLALLYHANFIWNQYIRNLQIRNDLKFMMLIDSGYFRMVHSKTREHLRWIYENMNIESSLNNDCVAYYNKEQCLVDENGQEECHKDGDGSPFDCLFLEHLVKFIDPEIKIFLVQSRFDINVRSNNQTKEKEIFNEMGEEYSDHILNEFLKVDEKGKARMENRAAFIDSCKHHSGQWNNIEIYDSGRWYVATEAVYEFYHSKKGDSARNLWFQKRQYPCHDCCFISEASKHVPAPVRGCGFSLWD